MYDPISNKIIISRDVKFSEEEQWEWNKPKAQIELIDDSEIEEGEPSAQGESRTVEVGETSGSNSNEEMVNENHEDAGEESDITTIDPPALPPNQGRVRRPPSYLGDYDTSQQTESEEEELNLMSVAQVDDPVTFEKAVKNEKWRQAMNSEIESIEKNDTWELTHLPVNCKKIGVKWVFKTKYNEKGEVEKYKARLVARGFTQQQGVDYGEVFSPVARWDTIRCVIAVAALKGWDFFQLDVKSAFLHGDLKEEVYVE